MAPAAIPFFIVLLALSLGFIKQEVLQQENYSLAEQMKKAVKNHCDIPWRAGFERNRFVEDSGCFLPLWIDHHQVCDLLLTSPNISLN